jgi:formylglycine-generating enzyme required for sulfatase activity
MERAFDPYYQWLSIPVDEQPANHYRLLGTRVFEDNRDVIQHAADQRMAFLRTFQSGQHGALSQRLLNEIAAARLCLLNPAKKAAYDTELRASLETPSVSSEVLGRRKAKTVSEVSLEEASPPIRSRWWLPALVGAALVGLLMIGIAGWWFLAGKDHPQPGGSDAITPVEQPRPRAAETAAAVVHRPPASQPSTFKHEPQPPGPPQMVWAPAALVSGSPAPATEPSPTAERSPPNPAPVPQSAPPGSQRASASDRPAKLPVPTEMALAEGLKLARDAYQEQYARAQTPAARRAIAKEMLAKGLEVKNDPLTRFVLLRLARDVALLAEDMGLAYEAIDRMAERFAIDPWTMKAEIVRAAAKAARKTAEHKTVAEQALALMRKSLEQDACAVAQEMANLAFAEAGKARDRDLVGQARAGQKQTQQAALALEQVDAARTVLRDRPDDPEANLAVGRYECFAKGDWEKGLPLLSKGRDMPLAKLAAEDLKMPADAAARLKLGDAWWDRAAQADAREKEYLLLRSGYWYQRLDEIEQSLVRAKVENRLTQIAKLGRPIPGLTLKNLITNSIGMRLVLIPDGEFMMGSTPEQIAPDIEDARQKSPDVSGWAVNHYRSELPHHKVRISRPFYLGVFEVTQQEYQTVMGVNPSSFAATGNAAAKVAGQDTSRHPVECVSWEDSVEFCRRLSLLPKELAARRVYRLPSEAEWEYACRAGSTTKWIPGDDPRGLEQHAWCATTALGTTHPVGQKQPNAWGLYDMHGNVNERCLDWFAKDYYEKSVPTDPPGPPSGAERIMRGGGYNNIPSLCRSAFRNASGTRGGPDNVGFRVVCGR